MSTPCMENNIYQKKFDKKTANTMELFVVMMNYKKVLDNANKLKVISKWGTGLD